MSRRRGFSRVSFLYIFSRPIFYLFILCLFVCVFQRGVVECNEPIEVVSYKIGVCKVSPTGKDCTTAFKKISFNGKTSVVLCKPITGRMHQIRVHLQFLGKLKSLPTRSLYRGKNDEFRFQNRTKWANTRMFS